MWKDVALEDINTLLEIKENNNQKEKLARDEVGDHNSFET